MPSERRYGAFISYRHLDNADTGRRWAEWLHHWIESYRVPRSLVGAKGKFGVIPSRIAAVFRDEWEMRGGGDLKTLIDSGLHSSECLIVLCSPRSALSEWVIDEVRKFKELGKEQRIIPVLIEGEPGASAIEPKDTARAARECLPETLRRGAQVAGPPTENGIYPIDWSARFNRTPCDFRPKGSTTQGYTNAAAYREALDGQERHLAPNERTSSRRRRELEESYAERLRLERLRIMSGLLGVELDELNRRDAAERARRWKVMFYLSIAVFAAILSLAIWGAISAHYAKVEAAKARAAQANARTQLYLGNVSLAGREYFVGNIARVEDLLNEAPRERRNWEWQFLRRALSAAGSSSFGSRGVAVKSVALSQDGVLFRADADQLEAWDVQTRKTTITTLLTTIGKPVIISAFTQDGRRLVTGFADGNIEVWEVGAKEASRVIAAHTGAITALAFNGSGTRVVSAGTDKTVKLFDLDTGETLHTFTGFPGHCTSLTFNRDGTCLATGSRIPNSQVSLWNADTGVKLLTLPGDEGREISALAFSPDGQKLVAGGSDFSIRAWDLKSRGLLWIAKHAEQVMALAFRPDGVCLASASFDRTVKVWSTLTGEQVNGYFGHRAGVTGLAFSGDSRWLASGDEEGVVKVWDAKDMANLTSIPSWPSDMVNFIQDGLDFSPDGKRLVVPLPKGEGFAIYDALTGKQERIVRGAGDQIMAATFSPDGRRVASTTTFGTAKVWDVGTGLEVMTTNYRAKDPRVWTIRFSSNGKVVVTAAQTGSVHVADVSTGKEQYNFLSKHQTLSGEAPMVAMTLSSDGRLFASRGFPPDSLIRVWDVMTAKQLRVFNTNLSNFSCLAFSRDGRFLATAGQSRLGREGEFQIWDLANGREILTFAGHQRTVSQLAWSPDGSRLASASDDRTIKLWDRVTGKELLSLPSKFTSIEALSFNPKGDQLALRSLHEVRIWHAQTQSEILIFSQDHPVNGVAFSPDSTQLAATSTAVDAQLYDCIAGRPGTLIGDPLVGEDKKARVSLAVAYGPEGRTIAAGGGDFSHGDLGIWDTSTGRKLHSLVGHSAAVRNVAFSPDGRYLASASRDKTARLWDTRTGRPVRTFPKQNGLVNAVAFSPDGKRIVTTSNEGEIRVWNLADDEILVLAGEKKNVITVAFSCDGKYIVSGGAVGDQEGESEIQLWDSMTGQPLPSLKGSRGSVFSVASSRVLPILVSGGADKVIHVWDLDTKKELLSFTGHENTIKSVAFSPDGKSIASSGDDGTVRVWAIDFPNYAQKDTSWGVWLYKRVVRYFPRRCSF